MFRGVDCVFANFHGRGGIFRDCSMPPERFPGDSPPGGMVPRCDRSMSSSLTSGWWKGMVWWLAWWNVVHFYSDFADSATKSFPDHSTIPVEFEFSPGFHCVRDMQQTSFHRPMSSTSFTHRVVGPEKSNQWTGWCAESDYRIRQLVEP